MAIQAKFRELLHEKVQTLKDTNITLPVINQQIERKFMRVEV